MPRFAGDAHAYAAHMISPAAVISLCDDIVQRTMISKQSLDCGILHLQIGCECPTICSNGIAVVATAQTMSLRGATTVATWQSSGANCA